LISIHSFKLLWLFRLRDQLLYSCLFLLWFNNDLKRLKLCVCTRENVVRKHTVGSYFLQTIFHFKNDFFPVQSTKFSTRSFYDVLAPKKPVIPEMKIIQIIRNVWYMFCTKISNIQDFYFSYTCVYGQVNWKATCKRILLLGQINWVSLYRTLVVIVVEKWKQK